ncbi:DUF7009 family protein [Povalibacter sp.]|uniref:DUF7009 family protein n=1 Tax=Povalibacter sp. TaxID=1962978 RepID=UPI002F41114F
MNIRLATGAVRLRIDRSELGTLLSSRALTLEVALPRNHTFRVNVRPTPVGGWALDSDPTGLWVTIPRAELEALSQSLPSRSGLEHAFELANGGSVLVSFEVDVKQRKVE